MNRPTLHLQVRVSFGAFTLDVDETLALDGITALFGHSGCGKSTLLRAIAGLERGAAGRIALNGDVWLDSAGRRFVPPHRRGVGYVFQDAQLFEHLTVDGNLRYAERRARRIRAEPSYDDVVAALGLTSLLGQSVASLSGGETQRVAIGRTLLSRPRLLLLDEPLSALDGRRKSEILPYIAGLPKRFAIPIIYVSHAIEEVSQLARHMLVLSNGAVAAGGPLSEVLERLDLGRLTGRFEAGVSIDAEVTGHDAVYHMTALDHCGQRLLVPRIGAAVGETVRLRLRARDVSLAIAPPAGISIRNVLKGTVSQIAEEADTAYAEVLVDVAPGGDRRSGVRARITRLAVAELGLAVGMPVYALIKSVALDRPTQTGLRD